MKKKKKENTKKKSKTEINKERKRKEKENEGKKRWRIKRDEEGALRAWVNPSGMLARRRLIKLALKSQR